MSQRAVDIVEGKSREPQRALRDIAENAEINKLHFALRKVR